MEKIKMALLIVLALFVAGCGMKYVPQFALTTPEEQISVPHPDQMKDDGISVITVIRGIIIPPRFLLEARIKEETIKNEKSGEESKIKKVFGVWPLLAQGNNGEPMIYGLCYFHQAESEKNPWKIFLGRGIFLHKAEEIRKRRLLMANQDGGSWISNLVGGFFGEEKGFDSRKFENDPAYQNLVFTKAGVYLKEFNEKWKLIINGSLNDRRVDLTDFESSEEIIINTPEWEKFRRELMNDLGKGYKNLGGEKRISSLNIQEVMQIKMENPRITAWQRFLDKIVIGEPITIGFSVLNGAKSALLDRRWEGNTARSECERRDLAEIVEYINEFYRR